MSSAAIPLDAVLPPYRILNARSYGNFVGPFGMRGNGLQIPLSVLPEPLRDSYVALDYNISPRLVTSDRPIVLRNPIDAMVADMNATGLLEIIQKRELTATEQFVASQTMPSIWKRYGGPLVAAITNPTTEDAAECYEFAQHFSDPHGRIRAIVEMSSAWARAFAASEGEHVEHVMTSDAPGTPLVAPESEAQAVPAAPVPFEERPRLRM